MAFPPLMQPAQPGGGQPTYAPPAMPMSAPAPPPTTGSGGLARALSVVAVLLAVAALAINFVIPGPVGPRGPDGANGQDGTDGLPGANGQDGTDGISCWDLNQNGVPDVATEDRNGDLTVDVLDC